MKHVPKSLGIPQKLTGAKRRESRYGMIIHSYFRSFPHSQLSQEISFEKNWRCEITKQCLSISMTKQWHSLRTFRSQLRRLEIPMIFEQLSLLGTTRGTPKKKYGKVQDAMQNIGGLPKTRLVAIKDNNPGCCWSNHHVQCAIAAISDT